MKRKLKFEEICLYCKGYDLKKKECKGKAVDPKEKPYERKCRYFRQSDDAKFCFGDQEINDKLPTAWSDYKRDRLIKMYQKILAGG